MQRTPAQTRLALALGLGATLLAGACKRKSGPSDHYDKAAAIHQQLYVRELDDAYLDPRMDDAVQELKLVEQSSVSVPLAQELLARIEKGRKEAQAARDAHAKEVAGWEMKAPAIDPSRVLAGSATPPPPPQPAEAPDAGPAEADPYGPGASIAEINKATGGCLAADTPFREEGGNVSGTIYKLAPTDACKDKLPGFVGQAVLAINGRIYRRVAAADLKVPPKPDAGAAAAPLAPGSATAAAAPPTSGVPGFAGMNRRTEAPPAYEGQKDAPKPVETKAEKVEVTPGVKYQETPAAKVEDSTPTGK